MSGVKHTHTHTYTHTKTCIQFEYTPFPTALPGRHHVREPDATQMLRHLPVNVIQPIAVIWNQYLLHDG